jgi:beta-glucosidase
LGNILAYPRRKFRLPLYITEHGAASSDEDFRIRDLTEHLRELRAAMNGGADVRGFFCSSLLDNFEWQLGYRKKIGLPAVDFADEKLPRTPKPLADFYARISRHNGIAASNGRV